jgi:hypothetical protein
MQIFVHNEQFRKDILKKIKDFENQAKGESTRTQDVVKSINVLLAQYICLLKSNSAHPLEFRLIDNRAIVRFATEEIMRRNLNQLGLTQLMEEVKLLSQLFPGVNEWKNQVSRQMVDLVQKVHAVKQNVDLATLDKDVE